MSPTVNRSSPGATRVKYWNCRTRWRREFIGSGLAGRSARISGFQRLVESLAALQPGRDVLGVLVLEPAPNQLQIAGVGVDELAFGRQGVDVLLARVLVAGRHALDQGRGLGQIVD